MNKKFIFSRSSQRRYGAVALWTSGAAGDQNPRNMTNYGCQMVDGEMKYCNIGETGYPRRS